MHDTTTHVSSVQLVQVRTAIEEDAAAIAEIYNQGIEDRVATFETTLRTAEDRCSWLRSMAGRYPALVAEVESQVVGWAGAGPYRSRECYNGIGEFSVYVRRDWRGRHIGDHLLPALITEAERLGLWKLLSRIFLFNESSRALCRKHGFREVGIYEKHGKLDGQWLDVVIVERLIPANLT
jgi:L-amino acid N-acyltransferase YncA